MMRVSVIESDNTYTNVDEERFERVLADAMSESRFRQALAAKSVPERELSYLSPDLDGQTGIDTRAFTMEAAQSLIDNGRSVEPEEEGPSDLGNNPDDDYRDYSGM